MPAARPARLLILRGGALGDFLVTLPVLTALRARWPDGYLELVGYPHYAELARAAGLVDRVTSLHGARIARLYALDAQLPDDLVTWIRSFDFILTFLHDPEGVVQDNLKRAGARTVLYTTPLVTRSHAVDHLLKPLESLAIYAAGAAPRLILPPGEPARTPPYAVLHPGSGSARKNAPLEIFLRLARALEQDRGWTPIFLTGEAEQAVAARAWPGLPRPEPTWPIAPCPRWPTCSTMPRLMPGTTPASPIWPPPWAYPPWLSSDPPIRNNGGPAARGCGSCPRPVATGRCCRTTFPP